MWRLVLAYFVPKRWRSTSYIVVLFIVTVFAFVWISNLNSSPVIDFGESYEVIDINITSEHIGINQCPVCFGRNKSICDGILEKTVKLRRKKDSFTANKWRPRAHGLWNMERISVKHFGTSSEFYKLDNELCSLIGKINTPCKVQEVAWNSFLNPLSVESAIQGTMDCPSERLMTKVKQIYNVKEGDTASSNTLHLTSTLNLNQEPIIFQLFPAENGWPFPKFYGSCGRAVVVEDVGVPLDSYLSEPWIERAKLALEVIKIAKRLMSNRERWGLYWTEIALVNFAVTNTTVKLVDANQILVVDLSDSKIKAESKKTVNHCDGEDLNCLSFSPTELCQGTVRDQNYYAVCRSVLADIGSRKGLLHSPPEENGFQVMLNEALTECIAAQTIRREEAIDLIVGLLRSKITAKRTS